MKYLLSLHPAAGKRDLVIGVESSESPTWLKGWLQRWLESRNLLGTEGVSPIVSFAEAADHMPVQFALSHDNDGFSTTLRELVCPDGWIGRDDDSGVRYNERWAKTAVRFGTEVCTIDDLKQRLERGERADDIPVLINAFGGNYAEACDMVFDNRHAEALAALKLTACGFA